MPVVVVDADSYSGGCSGDRFKPGTICYRGRALVGSSVRSLSLHQCKCVNVLRQRDLGGFVAISVTDAVEGRNNLDRIDGVRAC